MEMGWPAVYFSLSVRSVTRFGDAALGPLYTVCSVLLDCHLASTWQAGTPNPAISTKKQQEAGWSTKQRAAGMARSKEGNGGPYPTADVLLHCSNMVLLRPSAILSERLSNMQP
jgi:hypothetical protein